MKNTNMEISVLFWRLIGYAVNLTNSPHWAFNWYLLRTEKWEIVMLLWISYCIPIIPHICRYCIQQWKNIDQDLLVLQHGAVLSFQLVKSRREEGVLKSPKAFFPNPPWVNSVYAMFLSYWWTKVSFPLKCRAVKSLKRHLIFSSPSSNPGNETTSFIHTCLSVLKTSSGRFKKDHWLTSSSI